MFQPSVGTIPNVKADESGRNRKSATEVEAGALYVE
jgi:hypothetical protein